MGWACFDSGDTVSDLLGDLSTSRARPVAIELLGPKAARQLTAESRQALPAGPLLLGVAVEGNPVEVEWQVDALDRELRAGGATDVTWVRDADTKKLWSSLTDYQLGGESPVSIRACLRPSRTVDFVVAAIDAGVAVQAHAGNGVIHGHLPDETIDATTAEEMIGPRRELAVKSGGELVVARCESGWHDTLSIWGPPRGDWPLMTSVKRQFDPEGLLSPGRGIEAAMQQLSVDGMDQ